MLVRLALLVSRLFDLYQLLVVIWCILSWIPRRPGSTLDDVAIAVSRLVEPYVGLFRRWIPPFAGIDFSPVVAIVALQLIERVILYILV